MLDNSKKRLIMYSSAAFVGGALATLTAQAIRKRLFKPSSPFAALNSSSSGARTQKELPDGKAALQLYSLGTPNGKKVTILLEELGVSYDAWMINIMKGDQFTSGFVKLNPNSKIPTLLDKEGPDGKPLAIFESGSILLYLAEKYDKEGRFLPRDPRLRAETITWLFFNIGSAPFFGQFGHFYKYATVKIEYGIDRYTTETKRILDVLDKRLAERSFLVGDQYTIADMAWFPWVKALGAEAGYNAAKHLELDSYKNVNKWLSRIGERPAVQEGLKVNTNELQEKHK
eukprot:TRINITY_DN2191_c0_g1_i1.p1 TRINITY_DN2191_c0_g1~~TRINITY_DN2191_c0_g1_i1.p1  ORF type:complete len:286 (-),score=91.67 TRINITY_DN2191_c0_g1_i1:57-914(-)